MTSHEQVAENITLEDPGKKSAQAPVTNGLPHDPEHTANEMQSQFSSAFSLGRRTGLIYHPWQLDPESMTARSLSASIPISKTLKNEYARKYEIHAGAFFMPSVLFYDPNPSNTGWSAGMNVVYSRSRVKVYAGIGVSRFRDKGSWQVQYHTYDSVGYFMNVTSFRVNPDQPGKVIFETSQETVYDSVPHVNIEEKTNVYTYVDIPVGIGLEVVKSKRFSLTVKTGLKLSLLAGSDEPTVNVSIPAASEIDITREVPARRGATWRYTAGLEASYLITGRLNMYIEPAFEQYLNSVYTSMGEYQAKKPYLIGVNIGARYWIK